MFGRLSSEREAAFLIKHPSFENRFLLKKIFREGCIYKNAKTLFLNNLRKINRFEKSGRHCSSIQQTCGIIS